MIKIRRTALFVALLYGYLFPSSIQATDMRRVMDLSGNWKFRLDSLDRGIQEKLWNMDFSETVVLPGTTDSNGKGRKNTNHRETSFLSRYYIYEGPAWYSKDIEIPREWKEQHIILFFERTRPTMVWVDDRPVGRNNNLSTPHRYDVTALLTPGRHKLTIRVDNGESIPVQIRSSSHACTESTQTNWNGIIGRMELQAMNPLHITSVRVYPQVDARSVKVKVALSQEMGWEGKVLSLAAEAFNSSRKHKAKPATYPLKNGSKEYEFIYRLGEEALLWSALHPALYRLKVRVSGLDEETVTFGLRDFKTDGEHFVINGTKTFLRGKHDACVFPLTGHTAMGVEEWRRYFKICKEYGLNHCRFHSWCPPAACFEAADLEGIYLQPELPVWGEFSNKEEELMSFLKKDGENIQHEYSNHASFVLFALGNELSGDIDKMKEFINHFRSLEKRHLYTYGSNVFLGWNGHIPGEDFLVTCRIGGGEGYSAHVRASFSFADADQGGYLNNTYPNTVMNFDAAVEKSPVPVIGHETGQFQIYPDYKEMDKYTGVLAPWNLEVFRKRLEQAGMSAQANDFFKASGAWSVELYRADIEMNLRSRRMAGFQLLDLQDYPGQGSAYVGILDAFMDSKGLIKPGEWKRFCCEVVPLLAMKKYCWRGKEAFSATVQIANYGECSLESKALVWQLKDGNKTLAKGQLSIPAGCGLLDAGTIEWRLPDTEKAFKGELTIKVQGTSYRNSYPLWIYPAEKQLQTGEVTVVHRLAEDALDALKQGDKVLLMPRKEDCGEVTVGGLFQTDYWNYRMFKSICDNIKKEPSPGTLGILTNPEHPLFNDFPTEYHTNWQWYPIIKQSYPLILDRMPEDYRPVIQVIDNIERNHKLGLVFELNVEGTKMLVCMADLQSILDKPEGVQFYASLLEYMNSPAFNPSTSVTRKELEQLFVAGSQRTEIKTLNNISYQ